MKSHIPSIEPNKETASSAVEEAKPLVCIYYDQTNIRAAEALSEILSALGVMPWVADRHAEQDWRLELAQNLSKPNYSGSIVLWCNKSIRNSIVIDEVNDARKIKKPILAIMIEDVVAPAGLRDVPRFASYGWTGQIDIQAQTLIREKLASHFKISQPSKVEPKNGSKIGSAMANPQAQIADATALGTRLVRSPLFIFSVSSFETQISPKIAIELLTLALTPQAVLVSAYDIARAPGDKLRISNEDLVRLVSHGCAIVVDSGNYEAQRFHQSSSDKSSRARWKTNAEGFHKAVRGKPFDVAFTHDKLEIFGRRAEVSIEKIAARVNRELIRDRKAMSRPIIPIIHAPKMESGEYLSELVLEIAAIVISDKSIDSIAVAERELGDGILARAFLVQRLRRLLNESGRRVGIHILGTGNPLSCLCLAYAGADTFDGLEWCRTTTDRDMRLSHFQHLEFMEKHIGAVDNDRVKLLLEDDGMPNRIKAILWNIYHFDRFARDLQEFNGNLERAFVAYRFREEHDLLKKALMQS